MNSRGKEIYLRERGKGEVRGKGEKTWKVNYVNKENREEASSNTSFVHFFSI
jgi:hypothetical protein